LQASRRSAEIELDLSVAARVEKSALLGDHGPHPLAFRARIWNVYFESEERPEIWIGTGRENPVAGDVVVAVAEVVAAAAEEVAEAVAAAEGRR
jgi:hypothetical protein